MSGEAKSVVGVGVASGAASAFAPSSVTGVQLAKGIGVQPAKGFWADAWAQVMKRPAAVGSLVWLSVVVFFAVFSPLLASGHPIVYTAPRMGPDGVEVMVTQYPLIRFLSGLDVLLLAFGVLLPLALVIPLGGTKFERGRGVVVVLIQWVLTLVVVGLVRAQLPNHRGDGSGWLWDRYVGFMSWEFAPWGLAALIALPVALFFWWTVHPTRSKARRAGVVFGAMLVAVVVLGWKATPPLTTFPYRAVLAAEENSSAVYTLVPFSPMQADPGWYHMPPLTTVAEASKLPEDVPRGRDAFILGTDGIGQDVLSQLLHACRLSISIGLVSTSIAVVIGVTIGALMGYFGGWVDLLLYRVVEIFMAVPVLFLLIVAAGVLPPELRTTYVMMAIIGCFTWTGAARFTRAEFLKLRSQDFVQSAKSVGLPLRSILFKHMLPNGVTPVLVESSFAIAAAILIEAILSFLGLGPVDQPSWGKLLATATSDTGDFKWWLAVFPGAAIFLTVLAYNLIGEALRDAIDPKLKKARV